MNALETRKAAWLRPMLQKAIRADLRRRLAGVWVSGPVPPGGAVLAPKHVSWWDGYLLAELAWTLGLDLRVMMTARELRKFPFLRFVGARDESALRPLVRAARAGAWVVIFPEGEIHPFDTGELHPGAGWAARQAGVPLVPVGLRVVMRGAQFPQAFIRFGQACQWQAYTDALQAVQQRLDADLAGVQADEPPPSYLRWVQGQGSVQDEVPLSSRLLALLSEWGRE